MQKVQPAQQRSRKKKANKLEFLKQVFTVVSWLGKIFHVLNIAGTEMMKLLHLFF
jgi:hypothetical protein